VTQEKMNTRKEERKERKEKKEKTRENKRHFEPNTNAITTLYCSVTIPLTASAIDPSLPCIANQLPKTLINTHFKIIIAFIATEDPAKIENGTSRKSGQSAPQISLYESGGRWEIPIIKKVTNKNAWVENVE
jgi:hypothetical protein